MNRRIDWNTVALLAVWIAGSLVCFALVIEELAR
jgi:hypothetical protein